MVVDFSPIVNDKVREICREFHASRVPGFRLIERPSAGFCDNFNYVMDEAQLYDYDVLFEINDDSMVHNSFISNALDFFAYHRNHVFLGGVPQETGGWNEPIKKCYLPVPENRTDKIENFTRLWWEMSACALNMEKIGSERFDSTFDNYMGVCGDNDFLLRLAQRFPDQLIRNWNMRFWHARGVTQSKFGRDPRLPIDLHKIEAVKYFSDKWGVDISDMGKVVTVDQCYKNPFNGKQH
jgi:hypothetical protein